MELLQLIEKVKDLNTEDRQYILNEIVKDDRVSITELIVAKVASLERFKQHAKRDIVKVAEAGMELGEKEMRQVTSIGGRTRKKDDSFKLAMVKCLVDAGAYRGTFYGDKIASANFGAVDEKWYARSWKPKTTEVSHE